MLERENEMKYVKKLQGPRVYLSPMCAQDAQRYYEWVNDPAVTDGVGTTANVISLEGEQRWLAENSDDYQFAIVLQEQDRLIGNCGIKRDRLEAALRRGRPVYRQ